MCRSFFLPCFSSRSLSQGQPQGVAPTFSIPSPPAFLPSPPAFLPSPPAGERARERGLLPQVRGGLPRTRPDNHLLHLLHIAQHLCVPEPQHLKPLPLQPRRPLPIILLLFHMLPAVHFDDKPSFKTHKIYNIPPEGRLAPELVTPEPSFSIASSQVRRISAILRCSGSEGRVTSILL